MPQIDVKSRLLPPALPMNLRLEFEDTHHVERGKPLTPTLIVTPKVIHQRRGELLFLSPQPMVNNFCAMNFLYCEPNPFRLHTRRHAELGRRMTPPLSKDASGETFAPNSALWIQTNSQRPLSPQPSIRPSLI